MKRLVILCALLLVSYLPVPPAMATEECMGETATLSGTEGDDKIMGTDGRDVISALGGNDSITGLQGDDWICAGAGDDSIYAGAGADRILAESGVDYVAAGVGGDVINPLNQDASTSGLDVYLGQAGDDTFGADAELEDDSFRGGPGRDTIDFARAMQGIAVDLSAQTASGAGEDEVIGFKTVFGSPFADALNGSDVTDILSGGTGGDVIRGGPDRDIIGGGEDDDFLYGGGGGDDIGDFSGVDEIYGGPGADLLSAIGEIHSPRFETSSQRVQILQLEQDEGSRFYGGRGNDSLHGTVRDDYLDGGVGDDRLDGDPGHDRCINGEDLEECEEFS